MLILSIFFWAISSHHKVNWCFKITFYFVDLYYTCVLSHFSIYISLYLWFINCISQPVLGYAYFSEVSSNNLSPWNFTQYFFVSIVMCYSFLCYEPVLYVTISFLVILLNTASRNQSPILCLDLGFKLQAICCI